MCTTVTMWPSLELNSLRKFVTSLTEALKNIKLELAYFHGHLFLNKKYLSLSRIVDSKNRLDFAGNRQVRRRLLTSSARIYFAQSRSRCGGNVWHLRCVCAFQRVNEIPRIGTARSPRIRFRRGFDKAPYIGYSDSLYSSIAKSRARRFTFVRSGREVRCYFNYHIIFFLRNILRLSFCR